MQVMSFPERIKRHVELTRRNYAPIDTPPFLILFINSICNMKCDHCFYWRNLNQKTDLTQDELFALSRSMGRIENLNLSGGEPFIRKDFAEICRQFIEHNHVQQIYVPSNGWYTERTIKQVKATLESPQLRLFVVELSLDGMAEFHDRFRGLPGSFERSMETYDALVELQKSDPRLRIHSISTATDVNMGEIQQLTKYLYDRCPKMDHHNLAIIRGDRKDPSLNGPSLKQYEDLYGYLRGLWAPREEGRYGAIVEPMLQWAKTRTVKEQRQVVPCRAGVMNAVIYANGDVSVCENHPPLGNLRERSFPEIWNSDEAHELRASIARRECYCTNEVFLWPSIVFQPMQLARAMVGGKVWRQTRAVPQPAHFALDSEKLPQPEVPGGLIQLDANGSKRPGTG